MCILTKDPACWIVRQIVSVFVGSEKQAKKAKLLGKAEGILATSKAIIGKKLPDVTTQTVFDLTKSPPYVHDRVHVRRAYCRNNLMTAQLPRKGSQSVYRSIV